MADERGDVGPPVVGLLRQRPVQHRAVRGGAGVEVRGQVHVLHEELAHVLESYTEEALRYAFVVVEPGRHRFRRLTPS